MGEPKPKLASPNAPEQLLLAASSQILISCDRYYDYPLDRTELVAIYLATDLFLAGDRQSIVSRG